MKIIPEAETIEDLIFITIPMLIGEEGQEFSYYEHDKQWWELRLYTRRN